MAANESDVQQKTQAIQRAAQREPVPFSPRNFDDGWRQAQALARSPLIPHGMKGANAEETTANVMMALMWGHELGVSPVQSLFSIHIIKGRPVIGAALKVGLVKQAPECLYFQCIETTAEKATWETQRRGNPKPNRITFTADEARKAGLLGRQSRSGEDDNWTKWTATMLRWRAGAMLADAEYPDVTRGLGTQDDMPPGETAQVSAIPETRPVEVLPRVEVAPASTPTRTLERAKDEPAQVSPEVADPDVVSGQDVPQREPGSDDGDEEDPIVAETAAIIQASKADGLTREQLDGLKKRGNALPEGPEKASVGVALREAQARLKAKV